MNLSSNPVESAVDDCKSVTGESYCTENNEQRPNEKDEEKLAIATKETSYIFRLKIFVILFLIVSAVCVAVCVYTFTSKAETDDFERAFSDYTGKIADSLGKYLDLTVGTVDAFVVSLVSYAAATNSTWPYVTLPDYAVRLSKVRNLANAAVISQYHLVTGDQRETWEDYVLQNNRWVDASIETHRNDKNFHGNIITEYNVSTIYNNTGLVDPTAPYFLPSWQSDPVVPFYPPYNWDAMYFSNVVAILPAILEDPQVHLSKISNMAYPDNPYSAIEAEYSVDWIKDFTSEGEDPWEPFGELYYPILTTATSGVSQQDAAKGRQDADFVGLFSYTFFYKELLKDILPHGAKGIIAVFENSYNQTFTYQIDGPSTTYRGIGDLHDTKYDNMKVIIRLSDVVFSHTYGGLPLEKNGCQYDITFYASDDMKSDFTSKNPIIYTVCSVCIFLFASIIFMVYDSCVEKRQTMVMKTAQQTTAIVSSLFPSNVRDRLFPLEQKNDEKENSQLNRWSKGGFDNDATRKNVNKTSPPIADLFPEATVLFADIAGFTAWSSIREPTQVFILLETLYGEFDRVANRRGVFKVETIGDSYVAVAGLPHPRKDHAVVVARFANEVRSLMRQVTQDLQVILGPDTGDLLLRIGLHSGPVTAGVLRGEKSRFQLFGDTVNTASRMESNGIPNKIHVSQSTVDQLTSHGKGYWVSKREDLIEAKGKGKMQTYWIEPRSVANTEITPRSDEETPANNLASRLVDWNYDVCERLLREVIAKRSVSKTNSKTMAKDTSPISFVPVKGQTYLDEVKEVIEFPEFNVSVKQQDANRDTVNLSSTESSQLREYLALIATLYNQNPFHNFEHATHVTMSVVKLMSRIVAPTLSKSEAAIMHDHTYGITSDTLTQFASVFSAIIHDVDHPGVPNSQFVKENESLAKIYRGKSIAEQHSIDLAWELLMRDDFKDLRKAICATDCEMVRFRQLVVNCVMATDIMDPDLKKLRNDRWERAFGTTSSSCKENNHRKATIVIEHLIQASDVAHTMQHWHIYRKWNERFFEEQYRAFESGRSNTNPAEYWYKGELGFFDFYIIPLAKKLHDCGVFGVSSDEYQNYAQKNRDEWELKGQEIVAAMMEKMKI